MVHFHRTPLFYNPNLSSLTPYSFAGGPKVYFYQPTSEELRQNAQTNPGEEQVEQQLHQNHEQGESVDSSVIYHDKNVHIQDHGDAITFSLDLPGVKSSDTKVEFRDGILCVEAERKFGSKGASKQIQHFLVKEQNIDSDKLHATPRTES